MTRRIAVVTYNGDLHALGVQAILRDAGDECAVVAVDRLAGTPALSWTLDGEVGVVLDVDGEEVVISELDAVWWRRQPTPPRLPPERLAPAAASFVTRNVRAALTGLFLTELRGSWLDHPAAIAHAENKLVQLRVAAAAGLRIPRTLVSQDPARIRAFRESLGGGMVVKTVAGLLGVPALTGEVDDELAEGPVELCPAIYQELVPGRQHLRVHCFGSERRAALIESDLLDWRHPLDVRMQPYEVPDELAGQLRAVLDALGLRMGVFDLKLPPGGEPVWLELNPQGQFLFVEALGGGGLLRPFAGFLQTVAGEAPATVGGVTL